MIRKTFTVLVGFALLAAFAGHVNAKRATAPADPNKEADAEKLIAGQLDRVLPAIKFDAVGLSDVVDFLRDVNGTNIFVNWKALEDAGVDRQRPVTVNLRNVKFGKALHLVLESVTGGANGKQLAYEVDSGVITISTVEDLNIRFTVSATYDIHFLLPEKLDADTRHKRVASLLELLTGSIDPASWDAKATKPATAVEAKGILTVVQTKSNQKAVENLLKQLQELMPAAKP
jgi:hypothetical protein